MEKYVCDRCGDDVGMVRLAEERLWLCERCYWNKADGLKILNKTARDIQKTKRKI